MNEKTCVTCAHAIAVMHPCDEFSAKVDDGTFHQTMLCDDWTERTDSVEKIALDMLSLIKAARKHPIVLDPNKMPGGQILMPLPETEFADRLRAQGIEAPK